MIKEMMKRLQSNQRNPHRWINFGGVYFQWKEKEKIQRMVDLATSYIAQLEEANKALIEKNNDLTQNQQKVATSEPQEKTEVTK